MVCVLSSIIQWALLKTVLYRELPAVSVGGRNGHHLSFIYKALPWKVPNCLASLFIFKTGNYGTQSNNYITLEITCISTTIGRTGFRLQLQNRLLSKTRDINALLSYAFYDSCNRLCLFCCVVLSAVCVSVNIFFCSQGLSQTGTIIFNNFDVAINYKI